MKTLVIHPKDPTTDFLSEIYSAQNWTVVINETSKDSLIDQIKAHDRIVMLGHGTENGLLGYGKLVIDSSFAHLLQERKCVFIWCHADLFVKRNALKGFFTGMIISEFEEAFIYEVPTDFHFLTESNLAFARAIKHSIDSADMLETAKKLYEGESELFSFNRNNLFYDD